MDQRGESNHEKPAFRSGFSSLSALGKSGTERNLTNQVVY